MKKNGLMVSLMAGVMSVVCLAGCSDVTPSDEAIVSFTGYDGEEITLITDEFYEKYRSTADGVNTFYNAIMEVITRYLFATGELTGVKTYDEIVTEAEKNVDGAKQDAYDTASSNGTKYDDEWDSYLEGLGLEDEDELKEYFIYNLEKEEIEDWYYDNHEEQLTMEYLGVDNQGEAVESKVTSSYPYHVRHILVSVSDESTSFVRGTITQSEAKRLADVVDLLSDGTLSFGQIAYTWSEDEGSAENYGDAGIMDRNTSFVNEFKLGLYAYDTALAGRDSNSAIEEGLGLNGDFGSGTVKDEIESIGLDTVPYGVFLALKEYAEDETDAQGLEVNDGNSASYPRNIYWNNFLNKHNPFVITKELTTDQSSESYCSGALNDLTSSRWVSSDALGLTTALGGSAKDILTDEQGRVIIGVRSTYGIHFMVIQKSIYDYNEGGEDTSETSLSEYYTTAVPGDDDYPTYTDESGNKVNKDTYVSFISSTDASISKGRADDVKSLINSFDSTYDYRLYEEFVEEGRITFSESVKGTDIGEQIDKLITNKRTYNKWNAEKTLNEEWRTYLELLELQEEEREKEGRLLSETCAIGFKNGNSDENFVKGAKCYVE